MQRVEPIEELMLMWERVCEDEFGQDGVRTLEGDLRMTRCGAMMS